MGGVPDSRGGTLSARAPRVFGGAALSWTYRTVQPTSDSEYKDGQDGTIDLSHSFLSDFSPS